MVCASPQARRGVLEHPGFRRWRPAVPRRAVIRGCRSGGAAGAYCASPRTRPTCSGARYAATSRVAMGALCRRTSCAPAASTSSSTCSPTAWTTGWTVRGRTCSGGQRRRVAWAHALHGGTGAGRDPATAVDSVTEAHGLRELRGGGDDDHHAPSLLAVADTVVFVRESSVSVAGHRELCADADYREVVTRRRRAESHTPHCSSHRRRPCRLAFPVGTVAPAPVARGAGAASGRPRVQPLRRCPPVDDRVDGRPAVRATGVLHGRRGCCPCRSMGGAIVLNAALAWVGMVPPAQPTVGACVDAVPMRSTSRPAGGRPEWVSWCSRSRRLQLI